jgi:hypothetical protein
MSASALKEFLDTDEVVSRTRQNLGLEYEVEKDEAGNIISKDEILADHAFMNKQGIKKQIAWMRDIVDKNQSLSHYNAREIKQLMMQNHLDVARDLILGWSDYGIKNRGQLDYIIGMLTNPAYSIYKRAEDGRTLDKLADVPQDISKTTTEVGGDDKNLLPF